jgi:hypothetical protein
VVGEGVGFDLEGVGAVEVAAFGEGDEAGGEVGGEEEGSPAAALADVDAFVGAGEVEGGGADAEDDFAEGHGECAAFEEGGVLEEPGDPPTVDFDDAGVAFPAGAEGEAESADGEAEGGGGECPEGLEGTEHGIGHNNGMNRKGGSF